MPKHTRRHKGFTLVELLVVIGIIAVLVGILLPSLSAARRSANSVKCLSNLRSLGQAVMLYGIEYKNTWPVAVHEPLNHIPIDVQRRWPDLLYPFLGGSQNVLQYDDIAKDKKMSAIWGCPEWLTTSASYDQTSLNAMVRVGYAWNEYTQTWWDSGNVADLAYCPASNPAEGSYPKPNSAYNHASERLLLVDSVTHVLSCPGKPFNATNSWYSGTLNSGAVAASGTGTFYVDAGRHGSKNLDHNGQYRTACLNALFCDGHANSVSVRQAWNAVHNAGDDQADP